MNTANPTAAPPVARGRLLGDASQTWWRWNMDLGQLEIDLPAVPGFASPLDDRDLVGRDWANRTHPEDLPGLQRAIRHCIDQREQCWSFQHRVWSRAGHWCWVLNCGRVLSRNDRQAPAEMLGLLQNVGAWFEAEEALRRDAQLLANVKQSIVCTDLDGIVTYWNGGATELYGWTAAEMLGRHFYDRMPTEAMREHAKFRMRTAAEKGDFKHEREDFRKDGTRIYVESRVFAFRDAEGKVMGVIGTAHDITARRQAEIDRLQMERQLHQAQKLETVGRMAGGIAHEFNNILAAIIGNTELALMEDPGNAIHTPFHEDVLRAARQARDLVARVLAFSRSEEPVLAPLRLEQIVAQGVDLLRPALPSSVELVFDCQASSCVVQANSSQIQQVLLNLGRNAAYAMRDRGGRLKVKLGVAAFREPKECASCTLPPGNFAVIEVSDTGCGIAAEEIDKIFDPFYTTKPVGEGSGLGLSIVQSILARHRGGVSVSSVAGVGTTFSVFIPLSQVEASEPAERSVRERPQALPRGHGETVIVIDDEDRVGVIMAAAVKSLGYSVHRFSAADEFHRELSASRFPVDFLLTDHSMPRLTGLDLAKKLRAEGHTFPIVIMSGFGADIFPETLRQLSPLEFLSKPFELSSLAGTMRSLLASKPNARLPMESGPR